MASPFASFSGRGQRGATTSAPAATRGRGAPASRGAQFQPRGNGSFRGRFNGNRGRGGPPSRGQGRGRGRGGGAGTSPETTPAGPSSQTQTTNSSFAQLNNHQPASNPFGATKSNQPFPGLSNSTQAKTPFSHMAEPKQQAGKPVGSGLGKPINGGLGNVPVENPTILAQYHERYDKVSSILTRHLFCASTSLFSDNTCSLNLIARSKGRRLSEMARWLTQTNLRH